ncbi:DUF3899 domain-containing protein [Virgibacillus necropolis]|uniref:DUF3899 domain-containing protein n=1 Tax=Virgibacillus necropolis TaxID=163877 RepID=A0A221M8J7_9BACI|nr:DUF3899 domain-containing protein [Virgibacillus necropolis]ASN03968.1 hypothetical protein CFK40_02620 [Virgibacillus necropolis]
MVYIKNKWIFLLINIFVGTILFLTSAPVYNLRHFIDSLFYVTLAYFILMLFLFIIKGRFFDGISWSFRRFRSVMSKKRDYLVELGDTPMPSDRISIPFYRFIAFQTFALLVTLTLLLVVYYS